MQEMPIQTLSEADSKVLLAGYGLPVLDEVVTQSADDAAVAAERLGFPCVVKLCGDSIAHKTERNLVRLGLRSVDEVRAVGLELLGLAGPDDGDVSLLVAPMVSSLREFIVGAERTPDFGPVIMAGVGGVFAETAPDVAFRLLPATDADLDDLLASLRTQGLLGEVRGDPAVDRTALIGLLRAVGDAMLDRDDVVSIDVNPVLVADGQPIAVDALVALR